MPFTWQDAFNNVPEKSGGDIVNLTGQSQISTIAGLKTFLDWVHIKHCLLKPYFETDAYPLIDSRELLPSFEMDLYEYKNLPGFSMVALARPLHSFREVFQYDPLHSPADAGEKGMSQACPLESTVREQNVQVIRDRLPKQIQQEFKDRFRDASISDIDNYPAMMPYLLQMDRAHVLAHDASGDFHLAGVYSSLPSDLDTELKRFGMKIGKFRPGDNGAYERNRLFVYQFLMELYGFPIASERRTSAALFSRRLFRMGENFLIKVLGQSDRVITALYSHPKGKSYPRLEKTALISVHKEQREVIDLLGDKGYFIDPDNRVAILRVVYKQHKFNPDNVREDRALSVVRQEVLHPCTGEAIRHLNLIKDASSMILRLNDIVRGEYSGTIVYRRHEIVQDTDTHEKRLKFLHTWLSKHQRRIIGYSDEFFDNTIKVLDSYLLAPDNYDTFKEVHPLYQDVWAKYSFIQQARKIRIIEDLQHRRYKGERINYERMLQLLTDLLNDLKFEMVNYFDQFVKSVLTIGERILNDQYLVRNYVEKKDDELTEYGQNVKKLYGYLVAQLDEFKSIRRFRQEQVEVAGAP